MALWTIGDLHLSYGTNKPMDIFGERWKDHDIKIKENWQNLVGNNDTVVIPGDLSWAINMQELKDDLSFLHSLPGKKILLKGNHDYWWETLRKMNLMLSQLRYDDISFLQNNHFIYNDVAICGTRGWALDGEDRERMIARETGRLRFSLESAPKETEKIVFFHFPPITSDGKCTPMIELMHEFDVKSCFYGHLHGISIQNAVTGEHFGINFSLVSADSLDFCPQYILK